MKTCNVCCARKVLLRLPFKLFCLRIAAAFLVICAGGVASADTLISVTGPDANQDGFAVLNEAFEVSWTLSQSYENVSISVAVGFGPQSDTAYLTNSIGPGTSAEANEVASSSFNFPQESTPSWITLFSGLDLGPGTYYLMLNENGFGAPGGVWFGDPDGSNSVTLGAGVSQSTDYTSFPRVVEGDPIYPPSAPVTPFPLGLEYKVETVPEPSIGWLPTVAVLGFCAVRQWRESRRDNNAG